MTDNPCLIDSNNAENHQQAEEKMSLHTHLIELRRRLLYSVVMVLVTFFISYLYAESIYAFLLDPLANVYGDDDQKGMIYTGLTEVFFTYIKISFYMALFVSFPVIACQAYLFIAPGLYRHERNQIWPFLVASPMLFIAGAATVYYGVIPMAWEFLVGFESSSGKQAMPIRLEARVSEYLSLILQLLFAFGIAFQLPILLLLLVKIGLIDGRWLAKKRKYAIIVIFIAAAILTPPDIISQIGLAFPLLMLYELSVFMCRFIGKANTKK